MEQYTVSGMSCAACSSRVEKAVSKLEGVKACSVNLLTGSMSVEGFASPPEIIAAVEKAGYGASLKNEEKTVKEPAKEDGEAGESKKIVKRLIFSLLFLAVLMYISMGHMLRLPLPDALSHNPLAAGLLQLLLSTAVIIINRHFFINGFKGLINRAPNMDTLVALGSSAAFVYSVYTLFNMTAQATSAQAAELAAKGFYFESAAMILTLITVGKLLEARSKGKTTTALKELINLAPKTATIITEDGEKQVSADEVKVGDIFAVRPGESIPADGRVIEGVSSVNEAALTGESIPADKFEGMKVSAATINLSGYIKCTATHVGGDTALARIIKTVEQAAAGKAPIAKIADKVSGVFVPAVIIIAIISAAAWLIAGRDFAFALARGISVLVISCPCALGLATPVAIMVGSGVGARNSILFKTAEALESAGKISTAALDKTGTITMGKPHVTDILPAENTDSNALMRLASSLEAKSEHPLAKAIVEKAQADKIPEDEVSEFKIIPGSGLSALRNNRLIAGGNYAFITEKAPVSDKMKAEAERLSDEGKTPLFFSEGENFSGIIAVADIIKESSAAAVKELHKMGIKTVMLTGDNERTAKALGKKAGVDEIYAGVTPEEKEKIIARLQQNGKVAMVGDGINDAPALTRADAGIAIGAGTDIAIDSADIVLMKSDLSDVPAAIRLSRATLRNIKENLFWAFFYNAIGIPLAAGVFIPLFAWELNPMFGAAAMGLSSFCVVSNALRLNFVKIHSKNEKSKTKEKETFKMEKTIKIEGMMCAHCEGRVKKLLEAFPEIDEAKVSHEKGTAEIKLNADLSDETIKAAIENEGYKLI